MSLCLLSLQFRLSSISVVLDFNASLNDVAPVSPMLLPIVVTRKEKEWFAGKCLLCVFFCLHHKDRVSRVLCLTSMPHSMMLLLCLLSCLLLMWWEKKKKGELLMDVFCVSSFFCNYQSDRVWWVSCLTSMPHSMMLLLFLQSHCLFMQKERKRVNCWWMSFVCLLSFVFTTQVEFSECCIWP